MFFALKAVRIWASRPSIFSTTGKDATGTMSPRWRLKAVIAAVRTFLHWSCFQRLLSPRPSRNIFNGRRFSGRSALISLVIKVVNSLL